MKNKGNLYAVLTLAVIAAALYLGYRISNIWIGVLVCSAVFIIVIAFWIHLAVKNQSIKTKHISGAEISQIKNDIFEALVEYSTEIDLNGSVLNIIAAKDDKRVEVNWPIDVNEVYFDFYENGRKIFTDWGDYFYAEKPSEICDDISDVILGFLKFPTRVHKYKTSWILPTITELQVYENGEWKDIYSLTLPESKDSTEK